MPHRNVTEELLASIRPAALDKSRAESGLDSVLSLILMDVTLRCGGEFAVVELIEGDELAYRLIYGAPEAWRGLRLKREGSLSGLVCDTNIPAYCADTQNDPRVNAEACQKLGVGSMIIAPIHRHGKVVGAVKVGSMLAHGVRSEHENAVAQAADLVGAALADAVVVERNQTVLDDKLSWRDKRFRSLVEAASEMVWRTDASGWPVEVEGYEEYTGVPDAVVAARLPHHCYHPDDIGPLRAAWDVAVQAKATFKDHCRMRRKDGVFERFEIRGVPIKDDSGEVVEWVGMNVNVEEREAGKERYRHLAETVPQVVFTATPSGEIDYYNSRWYEYTGAGEDTLGSGWADLIHPDDLPYLAESWNRTIRTGKDQEDEFRLRGADGEYRWFLTRAKPFRDANGVIQFWAGTLTDINDQKIINAAIADKNDELARAVAVRTAELTALLAKYEALAAGIDTARQEITKNGQPAPPCGSACAALCAAASAAVEARAAASPDRIELHVAAPH